MSKTLVDYFDSGKEINVKANDLTAVQTGTAGAGVICWWELEGRTDPELVDEMLELVGMPDLKPPSTSPKAALSQAVSKVASARASKRHGVISVKAPGGKFFLVEKTLIQDDQDVALAAFAMLEVANNTFKMTELRDGPVDVAKQVIALAEEYMGSAVTWAVSAWLCGVHTKDFCAVSLRAQGGLYFVPANKRDDWDRFWEALRASTSHKVVSIDAMPTPETVAAVTEALRRECETTLSGITTESTEGMTERSRVSRLAKWRELRDKLSAYEGLLGKNLEAIQDSTASLGAVLAVVPEG